MRRTEYNEHGISRPIPFSEGDAQIGRATIFHLLSMFFGCRDRLRAVVEADRVRTAKKGGGGRIRLLKEKPTSMVQLPSIINAKSDTLNRERDRYSLSTWLHLIYIEQGPIPSKRGAPWNLR